jgi:hypothetical protein
MKKIIFTLLAFSFLWAGSLPADFMDVGLKTLKKEQDLNQTKITFEIVNPQKTLEWIDQKIALGTFYKFFRILELEKDVNGSKVYVEIDNKKFQENLPESVKVFFRGKELGALEDFFELHLSFDERNRPIDGKFVDKTFSDNFQNVKVFLELKNSNFNCNFEDKKLNKECKYNLGKIKIDLLFGKEYSSFGLDNFNCKISQNENKNIQNCKMEKLLSSAKIKNEYFDEVILKNVNLELFANLDKKVNLKALFNIGNFNYKVNEILISDITDLNISDFSFYFNGDNLNKKVWELSKKIDSKLDPKIFENIFKLSLKDASKYNIGYSIEKFLASTSDKNSTGKVKVSGIKSDYKANFDKKIKYQEDSNVETLVIEEKTKKENSSVLIEDFGYKISLKEITNYLPKVLEILNQIDQKGFLDEKGANELNLIIKNIVNDGFNLENLSYKIGKITQKDLKNNKVMQSFGNDKIKLNARLDKNSVDIFSQLALLSLIQYLDLNSKIILTKNDYEYLKSQLPFQYSAILDFFAKKDDKNVLFEIKLNRGKVLINGREFNL